MERLEAIALIMSTVKRLGNLQKHLEGTADADFTMELFYEVNTHQTFEEMKVLNMRLINFEKLME